MRIKTGHNPFNFPSEILMFINLISCTLRNGTSWPKTVLMIATADLPLSVRSYVLDVQNCIMFDDTHRVTAGQTRTSDIRKDHNMP